MDPVPIKWLSKIKELILTHNQSSPKQDKENRRTGQRTYLEMPVL
jgi:hypothetical protein